ncbi:MAG: hypothetical protein QOG11_270 [Solirubrobacteraceae bacterium]|nr:hypothetical protein [Solirubrobacteraceae bacterium]
MHLRRRRTDDDIVVEKGPGLARGPAHVLGSILLAFGLAAMIQHNDFASAAAQFPDGTAAGGTFLGFEVNGWTNLFTAAAGGLLLFAAAQHLLAKAMSLLVGIALGACAVIALIDGDVLGLAAANGWTELAWGIAAAILVVNALLPRARRERRVAPAVDTGAGTDAVPSRTVAREHDTVVREEGTPVGAAHGADPRRSDR